jgi:hypothetical protein
MMMTRGPGGGGVARAGASVAVMPGVDAILVNERLLSGEVDDDDEEEVDGLGAQDEIESR